jgi:hypothetical protein
LTGLASDTGPHQPNPCASNGVQIRRIRFYASYAVILGLGVGGIVGAATHGALRLAVVAVSAVLTVVGILRAVRIDFLVTRRQWRVVNFWRSYEFHWGDVEQVRMALLQVGVTTQPAIAFLLHKGSVRAQATPIGKAGRPP